jgi:hypothetical protein
VRAYFQFLSLATSTYHLFWGNNVSTLAWRVQLQSNGTIDIQAGSTSHATSTTAISAGETFRLECFVDHTNSALTCRIFKGANSEGTTPDETISFSGFSILASTTQFFIGSNQIPAVTFWTDAVAAATGDWIGPAGSSTTTYSKGGGGIVGTTTGGTKSLYTVQFQRPNADIATTGWTPTPGTPTTLFDKVNEATASDSEYISSTAT